MFKRSLVGALLLAPPVAHAAPSDGLASDILACSALTEPAAQLACYNAIAARIKPSATPSAMAAPAAPAAPQAAPVASGPPPDFGKKADPFAQDVTPDRDHLVARVAAVAFNYFRVFTVTLDNGQIWRQLSRSDGLAGLKGGDIVDIRQGMLGGYHLTIEGGFGNFAVERIK